MRLALRLACCGAFAWFLPGPASPESLAEVAARERARRESGDVAPEAKVITGQDLTASRPEDASEASGDDVVKDDGGAESAVEGDETRGEAEGGVAAAEEAADPGEEREIERRRATAEIRGRYKAAEERVERARAELEAAREAREDMPSVPPVYSGEVYGPILRADRRIEQAEIALGRAERRLDEIADEARRAGVYPGDLRD